MQAEGRGRGRQEESQADYVLRPEPDVGLDPLTLGSRPELDDQLPEPPRHPKINLKGN